MKKAISLFLSVVLVCGVLLSVPYTDSPLKIRAEAVGISDLTFELNEDGKAYSVIDCNESASGALKIPEVYKGKPVTNIGDEAFSLCESIESVTIPDSVTSIGDYAFWYCESLASITIPDSVTNVGELAFFNTHYYNDKDNWENGILYINNHLIAANIYINDEYVWGFFGHAEGSFTVDSGTKTISASAFENCTELTDITIPDSVAGIGGKAFHKCTSLTAINVASGNQRYTSVDGVLYSKDKTVLVQHPTAKVSETYIIPDGVTDICDYAFYNCNSLTSIVLPDSVTSIGEGVFKYCNNLQSATMPERATSLGAYAFEGCTVLASIAIPEGITSIGNSTFSSCKSLTSIAVPEGVTSIDYHAFRSCDKLTSITLPDSVKNIKKFAFRHSAYYDDSSNWENGVLYIGNHLIKAETSVRGNYEIKEGTKSIADDAFRQCDGLKTVKIPDSVAGIGEDAFYSCDNLTAITIPDGVTSIESQAFGNCKGLTSITIPDSVTSIGEWGFAGCINLASVSIPVGITTIARYAFTSCDSLTDVYYPGSPSQWLKIDIREGNEDLIDAKINFGIVVKPAKPALETVKNTSNGVKVSWERIIEADSYRVYRRTASSGWTRLNAKVLSNSYTDTTAKSGTTYYYTVKAENKKGVSGHDAEGLSVKYLAMPVVTIANASNGVKVSWEKIPGASKYYVYRKFSEDKEWTRLTTSATGTSYVDKKASNGAFYRYTVIAVSGNSASSFKSSESLNYVATPKVTSLTNTDSGINVKWSKVKYASGYYVYRKTSSGSWSRICTVKNASAVSYTDKTAKAGTTYQYTVRAYSNWAKSAYTPSGAVRRLTTPVLKSPVSAKNGVSVKWSKVTGASGYYVYRKTADEEWQRIAAINNGSTVSYLDKTAKKGTTYTYTVKARYGSSVSYHSTTGVSVKYK